MNFYKIRAEACDLMIFVLSLAMFCMSFMSMLFDSGVDNEGMKFAAYSITLIFLILERDHSERKYKQTKIRRNNE